jgi:hypothetical protein
MTTKTTHVQIGAVPCKLVKKPLGDKNMICLKIDPSIAYEPLLAKVKEAFFPDGKKPAVGGIGLFHQFEIVDSFDVNVCTGLENLSLNTYMGKKNTTGAVRLHLLVSMEPVTSETQCDIDLVQETEMEPDYLPDLPCLQTRGPGASFFEATSPSGEVMLLRRRPTPSAAPPSPPPPAISQPSGADNTAWGRQM